MTMTKKKLVVTPTTFTASFLIFPHHAAFNRTWRETMVVENLHGGYGASLWIHAKALPYCTC
jgi:hypothetical protein